MDFPISEEIEKLKKGDKLEKTSTLLLNFIFMNNSALSKVTICFHITIVHFSAFD